jgi:hypothetical protein
MTLYCNKDQYGTIAPPGIIIQVKTYNQLCFVRVQLFFFLEYVKVLLIFVFKKKMFDALGMKKYTKAQSPVVAKEYSNSELVGRTWEWLKEILLFCYQGKENGGTVPGR